MSCTQKEIQEEFFKALRNSIGDRANHFLYEDSEKAYYDEEYFKEICFQYKKSGNSNSLEMCEDKKRKGLYKICSIASSGRLTYLHFCKYGNVFEKPISNGVRGGNTKMDVVIGDTYYECKCQEVIKGEKKKLSKAYKESPLFKEFGINVSVPKDKDYLEFCLKDMGIDSNKKYYELHFNVKQLICHLMAIAHKRKEEKVKEALTLQYVIFRPAEFEKYDELRDLYKKLDEEWKALWASPNIQGFIRAENHNILLPDPDFIDVSTIQDVVYDELYKKKAK